MDTGVSVMTGLNKVIACSSGSDSIGSLSVHCWTPRRLNRRPKRSLEPVKIAIRFSDSRMFRLPSVLPIPQESIFQRHHFRDDASSKNCVGGDQGIGRGGGSCGRESSWGLCPESHT